MTDEQILPLGPVQKALRAQNKRISLLQEQVDAISSLLDAHYEAFLRHVHIEHNTVTELVINEHESRQEAERHDG